MQPITQLPDHHYNLALGLKLDVEFSKIGSLMISRVTLSKILSVRNGSGPASHLVPQHALDAPGKRFDVCRQEDGGACSRPPIQITAADLKLILYHCRG